MKKHFKTAMIMAALLTVGAAGAVAVPKFTASKTIENTVAESGVTVHYRWDGEGGTPRLYYTSVNGESITMEYPGVPMNREANGWYSYTVKGTDKLDFQVVIDGVDFQTSKISCDAGEYWFDEDRFVKNPTENYKAATGQLKAENMTAEKAKAVTAQTMKKNVTDKNSSKSNRRQKESGNYNPL